MFSAEWIRGIQGVDSDCLDALAYLAENGTKYPGGSYVPPMRVKENTEENKPMIGLYIRVGRKTRIGPTGIKVTSLSWTDSNGCHDTSVTGTPLEIATSLAQNVLKWDRSGWVIVTSGLRRAALDALMETIGPCLLDMGYSLQPCITSGSVSWMKIRKGKRSWVITYFETMTGLGVDTGLELCPDQDAVQKVTHQDRLHQAIYLAAKTYSDWLMGIFGVAVRPTVGMASVQCARRFLDGDVWKWRPDPLLVAMERQGMGYRSGITYAKRFRGRTWRIDVNRQYTAALSARLPMRSRLGRWGESENGVFLCRVRPTREMVYPIGIWAGTDNGFKHSASWDSEIVSVLHSEEFGALQSIGCEISPAIGFIHTRTFSFARYGECLQHILDTFGKESPQGRACKPLGNYVYGKMAQKPTRTELLFSDGKPEDREWWPYWDQQGNAWDNVWEKETTKYTSSQHIDVAGTIAAIARNQTVSMWGWLETQGIRVVRCHTDSLTLDRDPSDYLTFDDDTIGGWRMEYDDMDTIIVGPNAYFDSDGAHIAGVSNPTVEMIERLYDGAIVHIVQEENIPRSGWKRGKHQSGKNYSATAI